ncbi:hypothetical protein PoB_004774600 [Plakobranchus ocellatus]|uniref:Tc1-like transposase DDE domain-containing protein n=1 Tax=Plakobranchus ocellatus TaxID=259542 RepID=A0AAV4BQB7_9GAST|nr:hypothetical protein PoB_004774600 [Plakobranchus ocellatus]
MDSSLQHDNARLHTSRQTPEALRQLDFTAYRTLHTALILPPLTIICFPNSRSTCRAITMTMMRKLSQMFADGTVDSRLNSSLTGCAN